MEVQENVCRAPELPVSAPTRVPISGIHKIKGVVDKLPGRAKQGVVKPGEEVVSMHTYAALANALQAERGKEATWWRRPRFRAAKRLRWARRPSRGDAL